jgi:cobalt-zinc-cadmium efflux system protein
VLALSGLVMVAELVGGLFAHSIAVINDALHTLTHFVTIGLSYLAIVIAMRPAPPDKTYRYWRLEILASLISGISLIPICGFVLYEAIDRWFHPEEVKSRIMLVMGGVGFLVNIVSAATLHPHSKDDHNIRGAFLHLLADSLTSVGVIGAGIVVAATGWKQADPVAAGLISLVILWWCAALIRDSGRILLESAPKHMNLEEIHQSMNRIEGVLEVHDLHVWTITSRMYALTAHVRVRDDARVSDTEVIGERLQRMLDERYEINHATLQFEVCEAGRLDCVHDHAPAGPEDGGKEGGP